MTADHESNQNLGRYRVGFDSVVDCRRQTAKEIERGVKLIGRFMNEDKLTAEKALANFCLVALNLNEFMYLD